MFSSAAVSDPVRLVPIARGDVDRTYDAQSRRASSDRYEVRHVDLRRAARRGRAARAAGRDRAIGPPDCPGGANQRAQGCRRRARRGERPLRRRVARARDRRRRRRSASACWAAATAWSGCANGSRSTAPASRPTVPRAAASPSASCCRSDDERPARRRPSALSVGRARSSIVGEQPGTRVVILTTFGRTATSTTHSAPASASRHARLSPRGTDRYCENRGPRTRLDLWFGPAR
jgi:hypothetical protein